MSAYLLEIASNPVNWAILITFLIQIYKLLRPSLPVSITTPGDKVTDFFSWAIPACYQVVQELEKKEVISGSSKLSTFIDKLFEEASKQKITLSAEDVLKAKTIVAGIAASDKPGVVLANPTPSVPPTK